jgi:hypothetical protein
MAMAFGHGLSDKEMVVINSVFAAYFVLIYIYYLYCLIRCKGADEEKIQLTVGKNKVVRKGSKARVSVGCYDFVYGGFLGLKRDKANKKYLAAKAKKEDYIYVKKVGGGYVCNYDSLSLYPFLPALFFIFIVFIFYK